MFYCVILLCIIVTGKLVIGGAYCRGKACIQCTCLVPSEGTQQVPIQCKDSQNILSLEWSWRTIQYQLRLGQYCSESNFYTGQREVSCFSTKGGIRLPSNGVGFPTILDMYRLCVGQNSCNITIITKIHPMTIEIPFVCKSESSMVDIYKPVSKCRVTHLDLFLSGDNHQGQNLNCDCTVSVSNTSLPVNLYVYFINLSERSCNNVSITSNDQNMFNCTKSGLQRLSQSLGTIDGEFKIQMTDLDVDDGDMLYITLGGTGRCIMDVSCSGCDNTVPTESINTQQVTSEHILTYESLLPEITTDEDFPSVYRRKKQTTTTDSISTIDRRTGQSTTADIISSIDRATVVANTTEDAGGDYDNKSINKYIIYGILAAILVIFMVVLLTVICYSRYKRQELQQEDVVYLTSLGPEDAQLVCTNYNYMGDQEQISQT